MGKHNIARATLKCDRCNDLYDLRLDKIEPYQALFEGKNLCKDCRSHHTLKKRKNETNPLAKETGRVGQTGKPIYSVSCAYCSTEFEVPYAKRDRRYCSKRCQVKGTPKLSIKKISQCVICGTEFSHYGEQKTCSDLCYAQNLSRQRIGENNPAFKADKDHHAVCQQCGDEFTYQRAGMKKGRVRVFCSTQCGKDYAHEHGPHCRFNDISNYDPTKYIGFDPPLKASIRERDGFACVLCGEKENPENDNHPVHHIDYDTNNQDPENLATLCVRCHNWTNSNRHFWQNVFASLRGGAKIVKKVWGIESHITNSAEFCLKYLIFFKGGKLSLHTHGIKKELFHCLQGKLGVRLVKDGVEEKLLIKAGGKILLEPGVFHQLEAFSHSIIVEVSTQDFKEDSYRLEPSSFNAENDLNIQVYQ